MKKRDGLGLTDGANQALMGPGDDGKAKGIALDLSRDIRGDAADDEFERY